MRFAIDAVFQREFKKPWGGLCEIYDDLFSIPVVFPFDPKAGMAGCEEPLPEESVERLSACLFHRVLEIGCGTGLETIPLSRAGVDIVALDISGRMLEELDRSARAASVRERIDSRKRSASELATIVREYGPGSFDGAFSHFGALNCEPNLEPVPNALHELVKPNGKLSLGILNRTCLAEIVLFAAGHRPRRALARLQPSVPVGQSRFGVAVFPYGPVEITRRFSPFFSKEKEIGVSVCVPPPELGNRLLTHNTFLSLLEAVDRSLARWPFFRRLGDYVMMQFSRR